MSDVITGKIDRKYMGHLIDAGLLCHGLKGCRYAYMPHDSIWYPGEVLIPVEQVARAEVKK